MNIGRCFQRLEKLHVVVVDLRYFLISDKLKGYQFV